MISLLNDCSHFIRDFFPAIRISALQVYCSGLSFTPKETLIYKTYAKLLHTPVKVQNLNGQKTWDLCRQTMGHLEFLESAAFSPDGTHVVSGSYDKTLK